MKRLLLCAASLISFSYCHAQEDPFGAGPRPAAAPAAAATAPPAPEEAKREPLVIELLRAGNPTTPEQLIAAAQGALQFGRPDETKRYLAKLIESKPADELLAPLTVRYGGLLFQLTRNADLQPEGKQAADMILAAAERYDQSAERITGSIARLSDPAPGVPQEALGELAQAGTAAVNPMLRVLADTNRANEHSHIRAALVALGGTVEQPLIAALDTSNSNMKLQIVAVLGRMRSSQAAVHLVRPAVDPAAPHELRQLARAALTRIVGAAPDTYEAAEFLQREADRLLKGELPIAADPDDIIRLWSWDEANQGVTSITLPAADTAVLLASRVAGDLEAIKPGDNAALRLLLLTKLELAKTLAGLDQPLPIAAGTAGAQAIAAGPQVMSQVLADAMLTGRVPASIAAAEALGHCVDPSVLGWVGQGRDSGRRPSGIAPSVGGPALAGPTLQAGPAVQSPLADALTFSDRRVRMAAALAAIKLAPGRSFPGASRVGDNLAWFTRTSGSSFVLVGHPRGEEAQSLVGFMNELGLEGEAAYTGRILAERVFEGPDYEFILISDTIDSPPVEELVQWLRRDYRTARQLVGVMARGERLDMLRERFADDPFTTVFPRLHSLEFATREIDELRAIAGRNFVSRDERVAQALTALSALAALAKNETTLVQYDLLKHEPAIIHALNVPALSSDAAKLLGIFGTPMSQAALVNFTSQSSRELADRQAAASAFAAAVKSRGLRLTQQQILTQYERYNASAKLDAGTQEVLGAILDAMESRLSSALSPSAPR